MSTTPDSQTRSSSAERLASVRTRLRGNLIVSIAKTTYTTRQHWKERTRLKEERDMVLAGEVVDPARPNRDIAEIDKDLENEAKLTESIAGMGCTTRWLS